MATMTAHTMSGDCEQCLGAGTENDITKPIKAATPRRVLDKWARRTESMRSVAVATQLSTPRPCETNRSRTIPFTKKKRPPQTGTALQYLMLLACLSTDRRRHRHHRHHRHRVLREAWLR